MKLSLWHYCNKDCCVALRGRAWIEISISATSLTLQRVALRGRAWIEIPDKVAANMKLPGRPPREGVD